jgi:CRISPR-associated protein Cmr3
MSLWIIEPHEPLVFRDGRPFGPHPGVRAQSLPFPFPSTTTGAARTQIGLDEHGIFTWETDKLDELKQIAVRGPLLVQLPEPGDEQEQLHWFAPAPADALLLKPSKEDKPEVKAWLKRLIPLQRDENVYTDLTELSSQFGPPLHLVGSTSMEHSKGKPVDNPPVYWHWKVFENWLRYPDDHEINNLHELGIRGLQSETRVHMRMDRDKHTAADGALFETRGLSFTTSDEGEKLHKARQLALAINIDGKDPEHAGFSTLGGERRMVYWHASNTDFPKCPKEVIEQIKDDKGACRVILLTPAYFERGGYPEKLAKGLLQELHGVQPEVKAIAVQRPQVVSGWDFTRKPNGRSQGSPKKTRRLAPAGSVFFLQLPDEATIIEQWVHAVWMNCISDEEQDRRDGFGLAVVGRWDGKFQKMERRQKA